jgi:tetratricopeptide (TPR) repeat protein
MNTAPSNTTLDTPAPGPFQAALDTPPRSPTACLERSSAFARLGRHEEAIADCNRVLQLTAKIIEAHLLRGEILLQLDRNSEAVADFTAALTIDPTNATAFNGRGLAHGKLGRLDEALGDLSEAIRLNPQHAPAFANRASILQRRKKHGPALQDWARALLLDQKHALAFCNQLRLSHEAAGEHDLAAADQALATLLRCLSTRQPPAHPAITRPVSPRSGSGSSRSGPALLPDQQSPEATTVAAAAETLADQIIFPGPPAQPATAVRHDTAPERRAAPKPVTTPNARSAPGLSDYEREQALFHEQEQKKQLAADRQRAELKLRFEQAREDERRKKPPKRTIRKTAREDEDDGRLPWWKKGVLVAGVIALLIWLGPYAWDAYASYQATVPLTAARMSLDFEQDPAAARKKYGGNLFEITGTVKVVNSAKGPRILFALPDDAPCAIECLFSTPDLAKRLPTEKELTIEGECSFRQEQGKVLVVLADCVVRKGI